MDLLLLAQSAVSACGTDPGAICQFVFDQTGSEFLSTAAGQVVPALVRVLFIIVAAYLLSRLGRRVATKLVANAVTEGRDALRALVRRAAPDGRADTEPDEQLALAVRTERVERRANTLGGVVGSVVGFTVWSIAVIMILSDLGVDVGPLVAGAGVVGVALGFGAQSLVKDFLSGMFMLVEDQYGVGDIVDVGEATGTVEAISLRVTRLRDIEGTVWHVPNGQVVRVGNMSQLWSRSLLDIGVAYDTDLDHASDVIKTIAHELAVSPEWTDEILEEPDLWGVQQFGPSEVVLRLVIKTQPASQWKVNREFRRRIKDAFDAEGIEIPFPQRTIWVKEHGAAAAGVPEAALAPPPPPPGA